MTYDKKQEVYDLKALKNDIGQYNVSRYRLENVFKDDWPVPRVSRPLTYKIDENGRNIYTHDIYVKEYQHVFLEGVSQIKSIDGDVETAFLSHVTEAEIITFNKANYIACPQLQNIQDLFAQNAEILDLPSLHNANTLHLSSKFVANQNLEGCFADYIGDRSAGSSFDEEKIMITIDRGRPLSLKYAREMICEAYPEIAERSMNKLKNSLS